MNSEASDTTPGELLREVARLYTRAQRVVADCCGTTATQCQLLVELGRSGPMPPGELGQRLDLEKSWISRAVDGLVEQGWATRQPNPQDARSWLLTLTPAGQRRVDDLNATLDTHAARLLGRLSERERSAVERSLQIVLQALRDGPDIAACCPPQTPATPAAPAARRSSCR